MLAIDDASGLWINYFIEALGYEFKTTIVYQDNQSVILLERIGKESSSHRSCPMNILYFFYHRPSKIC